MERVISATEARVHFGEMMKRVVNEQEPVIVERAGKPQVVVISVAHYERLKAAEQAQTNWRELVRQAREQIASELSDRELPAAEEMIRRMREERDARLLGMR
jgi:prevent-host-death family protein